ncbi:hypothetical protein [Psychromonas hadalis]|uniref:hypothetical protein n=1 Tax=Psychromonas hadalis TaxID=211669 RepID=UPI0003B3B1FA|nr:hypothetical protein [Psychromonas hadalis]
MKVILSLFILLIVSLNLSAHNVVGGVYVNGADIEGEAGFSNGAMAKVGTLVKVFDQSGIPLGEVKTDDEGFFIFTAKKRITHVFEINMGAGHTLKMLLPADELPESLGEVIVTQPKTTVKHSENSRGLTLMQLEKAIAKQIKPLRREIRALKEKAGLRDIIGGIGYIFGLLGMVALLRERRLKRCAQSLKVNT